MALFAKNRPTKRIDLGDGDWVELQHISKGVKDNLKSEVASLLKDFEVDIANGSYAPKNGLTITDEFLDKIKEIEYREMVASIRSWSADAEITIENIKELSDEAYDKILEEMGKLNKLSDAERKN